VVTVARVLDILNIVLILVLSRFVLPGHGNMLALIIFICVISRSNLLYHNLNMEVHTWLIIFITIIYGPWVSVYIAVMSTWLSKTASFRIGKYNPILVIADTVHMTFIIIFASLLSLSNFFIPAMIILVIADFLREAVRFLTFHEHPLQYTIMLSLFTTVSYFVLKEFSHIIIRLIGGAV